MVNDEAMPVGKGSGGYLVLDRPWPAMLRTIWGDDDRFKDTYWSRFADQGCYFAGDGAKYDSDGALWLLGRVDDVMNVSGHRISTTEVESALVAHPAVAEAAVVGASDAMTGQGIVAFVILRGDAAAVSGADAGEKLVAELRAHVGTDRTDRPAPPGHHRCGVAEDPVGEDHAATAAGRRRAPRAGRCHDAAGLLRDGTDHFGNVGGQERRLSLRAEIGSTLGVSPCSFRVRGCCGWYGWD